MTATGIKEKVVAQRIAWIEEMVRGVAGLPLDSLERFVADPRNVAAADSYVRRSLEALLDLGRHILARGFGRAVSEYRDVARQLLAAGVLTEDEARVMGEMAGYRNRLVHFYDEVTPPELYPPEIMRVQPLRLPSADRLTEQVAELERRAKAEDAAGVLEQLRVIIPEFRATPESRAEAASDALGVPVPQPSRTTRPPCGAVIRCRSTPPRRAVPWASWSRWACSCSG